MRFNIFLPTAVQPNATEFGINIGLNTPTFVWLGQQVTASDADSCTCYHVVHIVLFCLHAAEGNKYRNRVSRDAVLLAVTLAEKLSR